MNFSPVAFTAFLALSLILSCSESPVSAQAQVGERNHFAVGAEYQPCEDCPTFVRVPDAPEDMRQIQFVSKYELTWRNYIMAVQDGSCGITNPKWPSNPRGEDHRRFSLTRIDMLKVDWPITVLSPDEIECYINWLKEKTSIDATLPSFDEWRWFASSGRPSVLYPWGNDPAKAAGWLRNPRPNPEGFLKGRLIMIDVAEDLRASDIGVEYPGGRRSIRFYSRSLEFFKVGQFPPSPWGLHDLLGNARELTSDVEPFAGSDGIERPSYTMAGSGYFFREWVAEGVNFKGGNIVSTARAGHFLSSAGVRLVIAD